MYVDMYTSAYQPHSPTVGLHAEGLALQCLSFIKRRLTSHKTLLAGSHALKLVQCSGKT